MNFLRDFNGFFPSFLKNFPVLANPIKVNYMFSDLLTVRSGRDYSELLKIRFKIRLTLTFVSEYMTLFRNRLSFKK